MKSSHNYKILIVEDEMIIAADLFMQLFVQNYQVVGIHTRAEDALKTIEENRPDLILMDIQLAGKMDGIEAAAYILETSQVPVIFLTAQEDQTIFQRAIKTKPLGFIPKPFYKERFVKEIQQVLSTLEKSKESLFA